MLKPLEQWDCDRCGEVIASIDDGWLEWLYENGKKHSFKIVHHASASPRGPERGCYHYDHHPHRQDNHLDTFVGPNGLAYLLSYLDVGPMHDPDGLHTPQVQNIREFVEIVRRLSIPHYEEARRYWSRADEDGYFDGANEAWPYIPANLKRLIERYGPKKGKE